MEEGKSAPTERRQYVYGISKKLFFAVGEEKLQRKRSAYRRKTNRADVLWAGGDRVLITPRRVHVQTAQCSSFLSQQTCSPQRTKLNRICGRLRLSLEQGFTRPCIQIWPFCGERRALSELVIWCLRRYVVVFRSKRSLGITALRMCFQTRFPGGRSTRRLISIGSP